MFDSGKKEALMEALHELLEMVEGMEMEDYDDENMPIPEKMQKVTVAARDEEGLKEGLSKADELLSKYKSMEGPKAGLE